MIKSAAATLSRRPDAPGLQLYDLFNHLVRSGESVRVVYHMGHWLDVDGWKIWLVRITFETTSARYAPHLMIPVEGMKQDV